ncbi:GntR family transcriptional regulator [Streptomyces canus]|uniref:DNA-binding GntR family transcriptional regulator n=1 Tax=Streptomyces canus TaxID=58343 RepID=A0AAW8FKI8_9ACTN|nr:GntR family transcriptional regulator [Streptomyces canus]MDQ0761829.1 DNA-binding GntR family transcriptional regulator [Streptomyces canus]MDQ0909577.1 DNA-binding GntR family transcriptional regulator [Streptomyces canus]MDQ1069591.1 DNA-binding GntR family transcriptional regulator [Streptomyces canus]
MSEERGKGATILATLRSRISGGEYRPGYNLPAQRALAEEFEVSRDTIQRVLEELKTEGWIESRQGSGSKVRVTLPIHVTTQPKVSPGRVALGPFVARAFAQSVVELDVFTFTSESLDTQVRVQADGIRNGQIPAPERIAIRILLPSDSAELPYPRARVRDSTADVEELDRILQARTREIIRRHTSSLRDALRNLKTDGLVPDVVVSVREVPLVPTHKLYLRRGVEGLIGPYKIVERRILMDDDTEIDAWDVLGLGSTLIRHVQDDGDPNATGSVFMRSWQDWFDSCWHRYEPS